MALAFGEIDFKFSFDATNSILGPAIYSHACCLFGGFSCQFESHSASTVFSAVV